MNFTWIQPTSFKPENNYFKVTQNSITHLKTIRWVSNFQTSPIKNDNFQSDYNVRKHVPFYKNTTELLISKENSINVESDFRRMFMDYESENTLLDLPVRHHYSVSISKCLMNNYYKKLNSRQFAQISCPGPQTCKFKKIYGVNCIHVNATQIRRKKLSPITFHFATDPFFTSDIGCVPQ